MASMQLSWTGVTGCQLYDVQVAEDSDFLSLVANAHPTTEFYIADRLKLEVPYFIRVRAWLGTIPSAWAMGTFTIYPDQSWTGGASYGQRINCWSGGGTFGSVESQSFENEAVGANGSFQYGLIGGNDASIPGGTLSSVTWSTWVKYGASQFLDVRWAPNQYGHYGYNFVPNRDDVTNEHITVGGSNTGFTLSAYILGTHVSGTIVGPPGALSGDWAWVSVGLQCTYPLPRILQVFGVAFGVGGLSSGQVSLPIVDDGSSNTGNYWSIGSSALTLGAPVCRISKFQKVINSQPGAYCPPPINDGPTGMSPGGGTAAVYFSNRDILAPGTNHTLANNEGDATYNAGASGADLIFYLDGPYVE